MTHQDEIRKLLAGHQRHLLKLQEQKAKFGLHVPPHIETEIEDKESEIAKLEAELQCGAGEAGSLTAQPADALPAPAKNPLRVNLLKLAAGAVLLAFILMAGIFLGMLLAPANTPPPTTTPDKDEEAVKLPPMPTNLTYQFNFETELPQSITLGICDDTQAPWYDHCYDAPERMKAATEAAFTGEQGLAGRLEISPDRSQVYTLRLPVDPPIFADLVSANVHLTDATMFNKISLAAHPKGEDYWIFSELTPRKEGWLRIVADLQPVKSGQEVAIDEVHIDMFVKQGSAQALEKTVWIDDIELYYPLASSFKTSP